MRSTLDLEQLWVSESMRAEIEGHDRLSVVGESVPLTFDAAGALQPGS
jgi:hypothetical protein